MTDDGSVKLSREQLYNEIWELSASGVAKKYKVPYSELLKVCKENNVPIPQAGYWTKLSFGKTVSKTLLTDPLDIIIDLKIPPRSKPTKQDVNGPTDDRHKDILGSIDKATIKQQSIDDEISIEEEDLIPDDLPLKTTNKNERNIYNRDKLYEEVWANPVTQVAKKYGVSDVAIHKMCKSLKVPVPPRGYWTKARVGERMKRPLLPDISGPTERIGMKIPESIKQENLQETKLAFLAYDERQKVLQAANQIQMPLENASLHKKIATYKTVVKEWNKNDKKPEGAQRSLNNYTNRPPFLAGVISNDTLPRVYQILNSLFLQIESLGGAINDDLSLQIRNEHVNFTVVEALDEIEHILTKQEVKEILAYEDEKRHSHWATKPNIRKYDYKFNGRLRICIRQSRYFKDTDKANIESQLGDMLIELYEESEVVRIDREAREAKERLRLDEERLRKERCTRYNDEIEQTNALINLAKDYDIACNIRALVAAIEVAAVQGKTINESTKWIDWAKKKADWFDPVEARDDDLFGIRDHEDNDDKKVLRKIGYYW